MPSLHSFWIMYATQMQTETSYDGRRVKSPRVLEQPPKRQHVVGLYNRIACSGHQKAEVRQSTKARHPSGVRHSLKRRDNCLAMFSSPRPVSVDPSSRRPGAALRS